MVVGYDRDPVLRDLEFEVHAGERVGLIGLNGGGKTTSFAPSSASPALSGTSRYAGGPPSSRHTAGAARLSRDRAGRRADGRLARPRRRPGRAERCRAMEALERVGMAEASWILRRPPATGATGALRARSCRTVTSAARRAFTGVDWTSEQRLLRVVEEEANRRSVLIAIHDSIRRTWNAFRQRRQAAFGPPQSPLRRCWRRRTQARGCSYQGHEPRRARSP
jgi:hypothetical protein